MGTNASFIYYRDMNWSFDLDKKTIEEILGISGGSWICYTIINGISYEDYFRIRGALNFHLKTVYPGLIIGSGYNHPPFKESDFQLGFYFDYTTGMPVIPGSTVKGVLKSVFPKNIPENIGNDKKEIIKTINSEKLNYINKLLGKDSLITESNWEKLFNKENIFFDAYISQIPSDSKIFAEDYVTPHKDQFKNPIPIRFLKIAPGVVFTFQFKLIDTNLTNNQVITISEKLELFKNILLDFGVGAKRNVGYGNLIERKKIINNEMISKPCD